MSRSRRLSRLSAKLPTTKSLAGSLRVLTGGVFILIVGALVVGYSYLSSSISHADRVGSSESYGHTLASLLARPISLGDYAPVEQSLRDSALPSFICGVRILTPTGKTIASVGNDTSKYCRSPKEIGEMTFLIRSAGALDPRGAKDEGRVILSVEMDDLRVSALRSILAALSAGIGLLVILLIMNGIAVDWALMPLRRAVLLVTDSQGAGTPLAGDQNTGPLAAAPREIQPLLETLTTLYRDYAKAEGDIRAGKVARQVAHDIRSPLAALEMGSVSKNIPEAERVILRQATHRIRDIANDLTGRFREVTTSGASQTDPNARAAPQLLPILIDEIVTEMRLRYRQRGGLEITVNLDASNYGLFAAVDPSKFRRILSNLIQNAVEAIAGSGSVTVRSEVDQGMAVIAISDTGVGISADVLPHLGLRGATFGKPNGSGLGLHDAKEMAELWNGSLLIESAPGQGTIVRLSLPLADAPEWFVPSIELEPGTTLVVLDDDQSVHQIWNERLSLWTEQGALKLLHFTSAQELRRWFAEQPVLAREARYLVDFELIGEEETGLGLVKALGIEARAILVTSRYDERAVRVPCERERIRLIPKGLAAFVPIRVEEGKIRAVLIDDDKLTHKIWTHVATQAKQRILTLENLSGLDGHTIRPDTPIYVDRRLANATRGEDVLHQLHAQGFTKLYLFTGDTLSEDERAKIGFVSGVVGKTIPPEVYGHA